MNGFAIASFVISLAALAISFVSLYYSHLRKVTKLSGRIISLRRTGFQLNEIHFLFSNSGNQDLVINLYAIFYPDEKKPALHDKLEKALYIKSGSFEEYKLQGKWLSDLQDSIPKIIRFNVSNPDTEEYVLEFEQTFKAVSDDNSEEMFSPVYLKKLLRNRP